MSIVVSNGRQGGDPSEFARYLSLGGAVGTSGQVCFTGHRGNLEPTMTNNRLFAVELISDSYRSIS